MTSSLSSPLARDSVLKNRRVTLMGLGRHGGGSGAARFLATQGARLTISDAASDEALRTSLAELACFPGIEIHLGGHDPADFSAANADLVVVNPAVPWDHPCLAAARRAGVQITSEIELFLERCPARVIGVSGSNGKSTTCTMLFEILKRAGRRVWLGGNIGGSLLGELGAIRPSDLVVLELSSFQLAHLSAAARLPEIAVLTNCSANHLDWHRGYENYVAAKQRLLDAKRVIVNHHDPGLAEWAAPLRRAIPPFPLGNLPPLRVPGNHNRHNAACAAAAARAAGVETPSIDEALAEFAGLEHRIEFVAEIDGRHFYNDSKSTSPAATLAALDAMDHPTWLLLGGVSKGTDFRELAARAASRLQGACLFGAARDELEAAFRRQAPNLPLASEESLDKALTWCQQRSLPGDAIMLSPACASFDQFVDYCHRGRHFRELVNEIHSSFVRPCSAAAPLL